MPFVDTVALETASEATRAGIRDALGIVPAAAASTESTRAAITVARSTAKRAKAPDGTYIEFGPDMPAIVNGALDLEPAVTNLFRNPVLAGGAAGSPGTAPTHMSFGGGTGATRTIAFGIEDGLEYMEVALSGTSTGTLFINLEQANSGIAFLQGELLAVAVPLRLVSGTWPSGVTLVLAEKTAAGADVPGSPTTSESLDGMVTATRARSTVYRTAVDATAAFAQPYLRIPAGALDVTFRLYVPMAVKGRVWATSPIPANAERSESAVLSGLTDGTYDLLLVDEDRSTWHDDAAVTGGALTLPIVDHGNRPARIVRTVLLPTGQPAAKKASVLNEAAPVAFGDARPLLAAQERGEWANPPFDFAADTHAQPYAVQKADRLDLWRFETRYQSGNSAGVGTDRAELVAPYTANRSHNTVPFGTTVEHSYSFRWDGALDPDPAKWTIIGQWHGVQDSGDAGLSPPLSCELTGAGNLRIVTRYDANAVQTELTDTHYTERYSQPLSAGAWHHLHFRIVFSFTGAAVLQVHLDGVKIIDLSGISMGYNDARGPRYQFGLYRAQDTAGTLVAYYANHEFAFGAGSLAQRIAEPLPVPALDTLPVDLVAGS